MTQAPPPQQYQQPMVPMQLPNAPGAVASLVLGIIGMFCAGLILGIIAIVKARGAKAKIAANPTMYGGGGMATAGLVLGIIALIGGVFQVIWLIGFIVALSSGHATYNIQTN
jgi:hypothetical protein